jgi:predicted phage terminase large subunit-like protein
VSWSLGHFPDAEFIYTSYSGTLAQENTAKIRDTALHESYREVFPEVKLATESQAHWKTIEGGVVYGAGAGGTITGFGAGKMRPGFGGAIVIDDPLKPDEARSDTVRNGVIEWYRNTLQSRANSAGTPIILIMQRLHEEDLAGWFINGGTGEDWEVLSLPAIQEDGSALWPEKHSIDKLLLMQQASPYMFSGQYQQRPSPPEGNIFKPDMMPVLEAIPFGTRMCRGWDFGASDVDGDPTCGFKLGAMPDGRWIIADVLLMMGRPDEVQAALLNTAESDGTSVDISLPQDPGQAGKAQIAAFTRLLAGFTVHSSPESGDKITRAEPFAAQVNVGNVVMLQAPWNDKLKSEMRDFPNSAHDDQVDAGSRAFNHLTNVGSWSFGAVGGG